MPLLLSPKLRRSARFRAATPPVSGGFTPDDIAGLVLWLEARDLSALNDGDLVDTWAAHAGTGGNATASGSLRPTLKIVSGRRVVRFNGTGNRLSGGSISITGTTLTAFVLTTINNSGGSFARVLSLGVSGTADQNNTASCAAVLRNGTTAAAASYRNNGTKSSGAITYATRTVIGSKYDGTNNTVYIDGSAASAVGSTGSFNITHYALGNNVSNADSAWFSGDLEAVLLYSGALSDADRGNIATYLSTL